MKLPLDHGRLRLPITGSGPKVRQSDYAQFFNECFDDVLTTFTLISKLTTPIITTTTTHKDGLPTTHILYPFDLIP